MAVNMVGAAPEAAAKSGVDWTPYLVGAGIGVLSWVVFVFVNKPLGITTALTQIAGGVAAPVVGAEQIAHNAYLAKYPLTLNYGVLFVAGVVLGGLVSALTRGGLTVEAVPSEWKRSFGGSAGMRLAAAFAGGVIIMYGARLAHGCTSGNGLSGGLQLALSGWTFMAVMFPAAIGAATLIYRSR
jgi:hypothetical protein